MRQELQSDRVESDSTGMLKVNRSRSANDRLRGKRNLSKDEVMQICKSIRKGSRYPDRDECMALMTFYHGLRVSELVNIRWQHINLKTGQISIKRAKGGVSNSQPIFDKRLLMLLRRLHKAQGKPNSGFVWLNERGGAVQKNAFQCMFGKYSRIALGIKWNPHALRHGCGTEMIEAGMDIRVVQNWLGHANIQNTTRYLHESVRQFDDVVF